MELKIKSGAPECLFTADQLYELVNSLEVCGLPTNGKIVTFSETQPADTRYPWQKIDNQGKPVGSTKFYQSGSWI